MYKYGFLVEKGVSTEEISKLPESCQKNIISKINIIQEILTKKRRL
jgi:hypothetical protein